MTEPPSGLDVELLRDAIVDVEAGYILMPDHTARAYSEKVAKRYAYLAALRSPDTETAGIDPDDPGRVDGDLDGLRDERNEP